MVIEYRNLLIDFITAIWLSIIFVIIFLWLPSWADGSSQHNCEVSRITSNFIRILLAILLGVAGLNLLKIFNLFSLLLWYGGCLVCIWYDSQGKDGKTNLYNVWQKLLLESIDFLDQGLFFRKVITDNYRKLQIKFNSLFIFNRLNSSQEIILAIAIAVVACLTIISRFEYPLKQLRFANVDHYYYLLATQKIITGDVKINDEIPIFSALSAVLSLIASVDATQTVRFFSPIIGILLVLVFSYCLYFVTKNNLSVLIGTFSFSAYLFSYNNDLPSWLPEQLEQFLNTLITNLNFSLVRQWTASELELGVIFLLLALIYGNKIIIELNRSTNLINFIICLLLIYLTAPPFLILIFVAATSAIFVNLSGRFIIVTLIWIILALVSAFPDNPVKIDQSFLVTLPVPLSLLLGLFYLMIIKSVARAGSNFIPNLILILFVATSLNFCLPTSPQITYLEYETAARKSLEIRTNFPRKQWVIVAPIEQLSQSYSWGWYEDLNRFVAKYHEKVSNSQFKFPFHVPNLFIFVEKRPLKISDFQAQLPYAILVDPTYKNYRSNTGRAALEFLALQLCEDYRLNHNNASIYYEDNDLRIYHFYEEN